MRVDSSELATPDVSATIPRRRKLISVLTLTATLTSLLLYTKAEDAAAASTASTVSVYVVCPAGQAPVGMWYRTQYGNASGWANWVGPTQQGIAQRFSFQVPRTITDVYLSVGCGGSRASWGRVYYPAINVFRIPSQNFSLRCDRSCVVTYVQR